MKLVTSMSQVSREEQISWLNHDYSIDVETEGLKYKTDDLIGVALDVNDQQYYFVRKHVADDGHTVVNYLTDDELHFLLSPVMSQRDVLACLHNYKYDRHFFQRFNLPLSSRVADTLMMAQLLDENRSNSLKALNSLVDVDHVKYAELESFDHFPKGHPFRVRLEPFAEYAMKDVLITTRLYKLFAPELAKQVSGELSLQDVFNNIWMPMVQVLQEMESYGFRVNVDKAKALREKYVTEMEKHERVVQEAGMRMLLQSAGLDTNDPEFEAIPGLYWKIMTEEEQQQIEWDESGAPYIEQYGMTTPVWQRTERSKPRKLTFNVGSPKQLTELVFQNLTLPDRALPMKLTKTGELSADVENLKMIKHYLGDNTPEYITSLLEWRKASKFVSTYLDTFINDSDEEGNIYCYFNMAINDADAGGTATGRLSSSGPNLQQVPSRGAIGDEARDLFEAREGKVLVVADYSNMETVVMAHYANDPVLQKAFAEGLDVHAMTACGQHNLDYDEFIKAYKAGDPDADAKRRVAKTILFGSAYGMGPKKLQRTLLVQNEQEYDIDYVADSLDAFNSTYQAVTDFKKDVRKVVRKRGWVRTIRGRRRRLPLVFSTDSYIRSRAERQAVNAIIQGSCADILFEAMIPIQAAFKAMGGSLIASVHDELIAEVPEEYAEAACDVMSTLMVALINPRLRCKLKADANYGKTWLEAKG